MTSHGQKCVLTDWTFVQPHPQANNKENNNAPYYWPLWGESEFTLQRASSAKSVSISWHHFICQRKCSTVETCYTKYIKVSTMLRTCPVLEGVTRSVYCGPISDVFPSFVIVHLVISRSDWPENFVITENMVFLKAILDICLSHYGNRQLWCSTEMIVWKKHIILLAITGCPISPFKAIPNGMVIRCWYLYEL